MAKIKGGMLMIRFLVGGVALIIASFALLHCLQFSDPVTDEDIVYAKKILAENNVKTTDIHESFSSELLFIQSVQLAVLNHTAELKPIAMYHTRNLKDVYEQKRGLCYDKSHAIEKILRVYGFEIRHISIYYITTRYEKYWIYFMPKSLSHAVTEVRTKKGWMLVDSVSSFLGLTLDSEPVCLSQVREKTWQTKTRNSLVLPRHYRKNYVFVYGVYSRNGKLYPPYTLIPDYIMRELKYNFFMDCDKR